MKKKIGLKLFMCLVLILMVTFTLIGNVYAEIGDSGVVLENGEETTQNLLGGVTLHEQDLKFLWDCSGNYYYEFDTQYLETQPNSEGVKIVTWSYRNESEWKMAGVSDIAENFEKNNPGWIVVGGTNADFFNIDGNGAMVGNAMEMGELIHPERENLNPTWRGILGFTKDNELITGTPDMTPHYNIHIYSNKGMGEELNTVKVKDVNPSQVSDTGITLLTKDINQRWDLTGCKVIVGYYDVCRFDIASDKHYFVKGTLLETRDGTADERPQAIDANNEKINEFYLVSKDGSLDGIEMNSYVKIQKDFVGEYANIYNSATYYWQILDQGNVLFKGHSSASKKQEFAEKYPDCDLSYVYAKKSRCLFGVRADGSYVMAVIGGTSTTGASLSEAAVYMKELGCVDAWDFDGGGSATLVARDEMGDMQTINVPSDAGNGTERRVGNAIFMVVRDPGFTSYKKNSTETSVTFNKKTDSEVFEKMENIKITVNNVTQEVANDQQTVVFENLKPDTNYQALIEYTFEGEEYSSMMEVGTKYFDPGYKIQSDSYGFTFTRYKDNDIIRIIQTNINIDGKSYNMGDLVKYSIDGFNKDYEYEISYSYTAEIIATGEKFTISVPTEKYSTLNYELPCILTFEEGRKTDDKLRIKYDYSDYDELVVEAYLSLNGKKYPLTNSSGNYTFEDLNFELNSYYIKLILVYVVDEIENEIESDTLVYEKPACVHEYDNACDKDCNKCGETRTVEDHKWVEASCKEAKHCSVCNLTEGDKLPHTEVVDKGYDATCEKEGLTDGSHCSVCNEVIKEQTKIEKKEHSWIDATKKAPKTCSVCGATEGEKLKGCKKASVLTILSSITLLASSLVLLRKKK